MLAADAPPAYIGRMTEPPRTIRLRETHVEGRVRTIHVRPVETHSIPIPRPVTAVTNPDVWARQVRTRTGLSQAAFAARIGVPVGTVRNWEQGRRPPSGAARALLLALDNDLKAVLRALTGAPPA